MDPLTELLDKFKTQKSELIKSMGDFKNQKKRLQSQIEDIDTQIICLSAIDEAIDELQQRLEDKANEN